MKSVWQRESHIEKMYEIHNSEEFIEKMKTETTSRWTTNEYRNKVVSAIQDSRTDEYKKCLSERMINQWQDAEFREKMDHIMKSDAYKTKLRDSRNTEFWDEYYDNENNKQKMSARSRMLWTNAEYIEKMNKSYKYKKYEMPSGKIVNLQGYENYALSELLLHYEESDIILERKNIINTIGLIKYEFLGNTHTYFPDFYIKSVNTIIEVKSNYTFNANKEKNLAKEHACQQQGFNFKFMIF